jgi:hypothetical protein
MSQPVCSFCKLAGHRINSCEDPAAAALITTAQFKCTIAIQYLGTGAEDQMYREICAWFESKKIVELKLMISRRNWTARGNKQRLVARAIWAYYFNQWIPLEVDIGGPVGRRYICRGRYQGNIANGIDRERATEIFDRELLQMDEPEAEAEAEPEQRSPEKIPMIDGLTIESVDCPICFETEESVTQTNCGHLFCNPCIMTHTKGVVTPCPCCRTDIDLLIVK